MTADVGLFLATVLRIIAAVSIALAMTVSAISVVGVVLAVTGPDRLADDIRVGRLVLAWSVVVAFLLAVARIATLAVRSLVDTEPR